MEAKLCLFTYRTPSEALKLDVESYPNNKLITIIIIIIVVYVLFCFVFVIVVVF